MAILYTIRYDNVPNADNSGVMAYSGYSTHNLAPGDPYFAHDGSMTFRPRAKMLADHARLGVDVVRRVEIAWRGPWDKETVIKREQARISALRHNIPAYGYNRHPQLPGINIAYQLKGWHHDPATHICSVDSPFAKFSMRNSRRTPDGMCSYRDRKKGEPCYQQWGDADPARRAWAIYDGREETLWLPGWRGNPYRACVDRLNDILAGLGLQIQ